MSEHHPHRLPSDIGSDAGGPIDTIDRAAKFPEQPANAPGSYDVPERPVARAGRG